MSLWWDKIQSKVRRFNNLTIVDLPEEPTDTLARLADRNMSLQCTIQDGEISVGNEDSLVSITPATLYPA